MITAPRLLQRHDHGGAIAAGSGEDTYAAGSTTRGSGASAAAHLSSMRANRQMPSAITQVSTNSPTMKKPTLLRSRSPSQASGPEVMPSWSSMIETSSIVPMMSATATDNAVMVML